ncbi:hypothetical protein Nepgr_011475 [Nepenthes gracilis]|uniref:Uncharacterized protein n=1 Tax=Nepenthes gracilis TaxID=150966 RepID=A0AAD3SFE6_NEPGR|nr:hypothetical protein Nepgr_011475 [Nepenthes gracilis]
MENYHKINGLVYSVIISLGIVSFVSCVFAEFKKSKEEDVKLDGRLCYLPGSEAFEFGIAGLICLVAAQITGNFFLGRIIFSVGRRRCCLAKRPSIGTILLAVSWISFGIVTVLVSTATSMNTRQPFGKGWLAGDCYVVKDGVYVASSLLVIITLACTLISAAITLRQTH